MGRLLAENRLVVASRNPGKVREINDLVKPHGIDAVSAAELELPEVAETGDTFEANALLKAVSATANSGLPALADDSGLAVPALGGKPGIYSARWAGPEEDFGLAVERVHAALGANAHRAAFFFSALALTWPDGHSETFCGRVDGQLVWPPRGTRGFGYDPMFLPDGCSETFGEMDPVRKHEISHRARAFCDLVDACLPAVVSLPAVSPPAVPNDD